MSAGTPNQFPLSENPHFHHVERAPYELGYLLRQLPADFPVQSELTEETMQIADAVAQHAGNANSTLIHGLEAIGNLMFVAGANEENEIEKSTLADLGGLISHIALEMQFLQETREDFRAVLRANATRQAGKRTEKQGKGTRAKKTEGASDEY